MLSPAKKSTLWNVIEKGAVLSIQIIITLIITRIISPEDYGIIAMVTVFFSIASTIIDFGMEGAIIQKKECLKEDYNAAFFFILGMSILLYVTLYFCAPYIARFYKLPQLAEVVKIGGITLIIRALGIVPYAKMERHLNFKSIAKISAFTALLAGVVAIAMAYKGFAYWALVAQFVLTSTLTTILYFVASKWKPTMQLSAASFKNLLGFGLPLMFTSLINGLYGNLYNLVIGRKFSERQLGLYNRASTLAGYAPLNLSDLTMRALYPIFSREQDNYRLLKEHTLKTLHITFFIIIPITAFTVVNCRDIVIALLTEKWKDVIPFLRILAISNIAFIFFNIHINLLKATGNTKTLFLCEVLKKGVGIAIFVALLPLGIMAIMWGILATSIINLLISSYFIWRKIKIGLWKQLLQGVSVTIGTAASAVAAYWIAGFADNIYMRLGLCAVMFTTLFILYACITKDSAIPFFKDYYYKIFRKR